MTKLVLVGLALTACGTGFSERDERVFAGDRFRGRPIADLVRDVGPPTRRQQAAEWEADNFCLDQKRAATESYEYDLPTGGVAGAIRRAAHHGPSLIIVYCVDHAGTIVGSWQSIID
ncbi:MAG: hypothetical protein ABI211_30740 [Vicinamibacterales bacterium]